MNTCDHSRSCTVGNLIGEDVDTSLSGSSDLGGSVSDIDSDDGRHCGRTVVMVSSLSMLASDEATKGLTVPRSNGWVE